MDQLTKWQSIVDDLNTQTLEKTDNELFKYYQSALRDIKNEAKLYIETYDQLSFSKRLEVERTIELGQKIKGILDDANDQVTGAIRKSTAQHAANGYYGAFYGLEGENRITLPMSILGEDYIEQLVNKPVKGKVFSQRLYQNTNQLAQTTTQSLLRGAIDGKGYAYVAKRIEMLTEADYKRALRIARTEGGRASSLATQRAYEDAKDIGIDVKKMWVSTLDEKTRSSHVEMDGQTVDIEEDFESPTTGSKGQGPRLMGAASEDINCRCTTVSVVDNIKPELRVDGQNGDTLQNMTYKEWAAMKGIPTAPPKVTTFNDPLRPDFVAGVKRGEIMTRDEANHGKPNPNFRKGPGYDINCQSCVVTYEARLRGYDVQTLPNYKNKTTLALSRNTNLAWIDPITGKNAEYIVDKSITTAKAMLNYAESVVEQGKRYTIEFAWKGRSSSGHIISMDRDENGALRLYDPQIGKTYLGNEMRLYFNQIKYVRTIYGTKLPVPPKILRIDDKLFDLNVVNNIMEGVK